MLLQITKNTLVRTLSQTMAKPIYIKKYNKFKLANFSFYTEATCKGCSDCEFKIYINTVSNVVLSMHL